MCCQCDFWRPKQCDKLPRVTPKNDLRLMKESDPLKLFGLRLRSGRQSANLTQEQLHLATRITTSFISEIKSGKNNCSLRVSAPRH
jgi:hypothetical protein